MRCSPRLLLSPFFLLGLLAKLLAGGGGGPPLSSFSPGAKGSPYRPLEPGFIKVKNEISMDVAADSSQRLRCIK